MNRTILRIGARLSAAAAVAALFSGCGLQNQEQPPLMGPSGLGKQVIVTASPDQLPRDAFSQSIITIELRDATGKGIAGQIVTLNATSGATLSSRQVTTG